MKTQLVLGCLVVFGIAAVVAAFESQQPDASGDTALAEIQHALQSAIESKAQVTLLIDGANYGGVPTSMTNVTVTLQSNQHDTRVLARLDRIGGVVLTNSREEIVKADGILDAARSRSHLASWADAKIAGTVTLDGAPLDGVEVRFYFSDEPVTARTNDEGKYGIFVKREHNDLGECRVRFYWPKDIEGRTALPERYGRGSTLTADVKKGENVFDFALTSE